MDETICDVCECWGEEKLIIYIGEINGCCAPKKFWQHYKYDKTIAFPMKSWDCINDRILIGYYYFTREEL